MQGKRPPRDRPFVSTYRECRTQHRYFKFPDRSTPQLKQRQTASGQPQKQRHPANRDQDRQKTLSRTIDLQDYDDWLFSDSKFKQGPGCTLPVPCPPPTQQEHPGLLSSDSPPPSSRQEQSQRADPVLKRARTCSAKSGALLGQYLQAVTSQRRGVLSARQRKPRQEPVGTSRLDVTLRGAGSRAQNFAPTVVGRSIRSAMAKETLAPRKATLTHRYLQANLQKNASKNARTIDLSDSWRERIQGWQLQNSVQGFEGPLEPIFGQRRIFKQVPGVTPGRKDTRNNSYS